MKGEKNRKKSTIIATILSFALMFVLASAIVLAEESFTKNTKTECDNGKCTASIYLETNYIYEDEAWKPIEEARSLKETEFRCLVTKEFKDDPDVECLDFNFTSVKLRVKANKFGTIPVKTLEPEFDETLGSYELLENAEKRQELFFLFKGASRDVTYPIRVGEELHLGEQSTTVEIQPGQSDSTFGCTYIVSSSGLNGYEYGSADPIYVGHDVANSAYRFIMCKFNISAYSDSTQKVTNATLLLTHYSNGLDSGEVTKSCAYHVFNNFTVDGGEWKEGNANGASAATNEINWDERPSGSYMKSTNDCEIFNTGESTNENWNVTSAVDYEFAAENSDVSILLNATTTSGSTNSDWRMFRSDDYFLSTSRPKLTITYESTIPPTMTKTPHNLTNLTQGTSWVKLNFTRIGSKYLLFRNGTNVVNFTNKPFNHTGLTNNTRYSFKVKIYNSSNSLALSNYSNTIEVRTKQTVQTQTKPSVPTALTCASGTCNGTFAGTVSMQCTGSSDSEGNTITYVLEKGNNSVSTTWRILGNHTQGNSYSWSLSSEPLGETYEKFRCRAVDLTGSGNYSNYFTISSAFTIGSFATESEGRTAIEDAGNDELSDPEIYTDAVVYVVYQNGTHRLGTYDKLVSSGNKRWFFNYITGSDAKQNKNPIQTILNFWENWNMTTTQVESSAAEFINDTMN